MERIDCRNRQAVLPSRSPTRYARVFSSEAGVGRLAVEATAE